MRITLKTPCDTLELLVKVRYDYTKPFIKRTKDEYGRSVVTTWRERMTTVSCRKFDVKTDHVSKTLYVGTTVCNYRDNKQFSKKTGRAIAWRNAIAEMVKEGLINRDEAKALEFAGLNYTSITIDMSDLNKTAQYSVK